jgi:hypothetical protein
MTLVIIESGFLVGMIALIWVMLDILGGDHPTDNKSQ